jgi:hypothetical protein
VIAAVLCFKHLWVFFEYTLDYRVFILIIVTLFFIASSKK